jgi:hypothetical protein
VAQARAYLASAGHADRDVPHALQAHLHKPAYYLRHADLSHLRGHPDPWVAYVAAGGATVLPELSAHIDHSHAPSRAAYVRNSSIIMAHMARVMNVTDYSLARYWRGESDAWLAQERVRYLALYKRQLREASAVAREHALQSTEAVGALRRLLGSMTVQPVEEKEALLHAALARMGLLAADPEGDGAEGPDADAAAEAASEQKRGHTSPGSPAASHGGADYAHDLRAASAAFSGARAPSRADLARIADPLQRQWAQGQGAYPFSLPTALLRQASVDEDETDAPAAAGGPPSAAARAPAGTPVAGSQQSQPLTGTAASSPLAGATSAGAAPTPDPAEEDEDAYSEVDEEAAAALAAAAAGGLPVLPKHATPAQRAAYSAAQEAARRALVRALADREPVEFREHDMADRLEASLRAPLIPMRGPAPLEPSAGSAAAAAAARGEAEAERVIADAHRRRHIVPADAVKQPHTSAVTHATRVAPSGGVGAGGSAVAGSSGVGGHASSLVPALVRDPKTGAWAISSAGAAAGGSALDLLSDDGGSAGGRNTATDADAALLELAGGALATPTSSLASAPAVPMTAGSAAGDTAGHTPSSPLEELESGFSAYADRVLRLLEQSLQTQDRILHTQIATSSRSLRSAMRAAVAEQRALGGRARGSRKSGGRSGSNSAATAASSRPGAGATSGAVVGAVSAPAGAREISDEDIATEAYSEAGYPDASGAPSPPHFAAAAGAAFSPAGIVSGAAGAAAAHASAAADAQDAAAALTPEALAALAADREALDKHAQLVQATVAVLKQQWERRKERLRGAASAATRRRD